MDPITLLGYAKKVWDLAHLAGGTAIKNDAGQKYIAVQGATGNALISIAEQQDTIDEILVGIVGDVVQGLLLNFTPVGKGIQVFVGASSIISGEGLGNELKEYYKLIKADDYEYWDYVKNWYNPSTTVTEEYAKILMRKKTDGTYAPAEKAPGIIYSESISVSEYNKYIDAQNAFYEELYKEEPQAQIENSDGVLKVTMPTGEVISEGDYSSNDIFGNDKNDYLYGNDGQDNLIGYGGSDELNGGTDNDTLVGGSNRSATDSVTDYLNGGTGYDTYYAGANDVITDTDGLGSVYFAGDLITGTEAKMTDKSGYIYKDANYTYKLTNPNGIGKLQILKNGSTSQTLLIDNFNATADEYLGIKLDKTPPQKDVTFYIGDATVTEGGDLEFTVGIDKELDYDLMVDLKPIFNKQVKEAVEETGFIHKIVNQETTPHDQKITDEIIAQIKSSRMIIADFTNSSTNVYFEAGYAMGMKIPVIWTCKEGEPFSFDTGQFPHITWKEGEDLKKQLVNRIQAIM